MAEKNRFNREFLREEYLRLRDKSGYKDNLSVAQGYVDKYPIDTRHTKGWWEDKKKNDNSVYVYRALGIRENEETRDPEFYLIDGEFDNEEDAKKAAIKTAEDIDLNGIKEDLIDIMVLSLHKHRIYRGGNTLKQKTMTDVDDVDIETHKQKFSEEICAELDALENLNDINQMIAKGYENASEYSAKGKELRNYVIDGYIHELNMNDSPFDIAENFATFTYIDEKDKIRNKPKLEKFIRSSTIKMSVCVAVIDFLAGLKVTTSAAVVLSDSHKWRIGEGLDEGLRSSLLNTAIIGNTNQSLKEMIRNMITHQFDIQPLFSENGRCIGCLELKSLSREMGVHGYRRIGDEIDIKKLDDLKLIGPPPPLINAINELHWFSRLLGDRLDALLFHWEPETNPLHQKIMSKSNPLLEPGLHIITSHDVLAYVEYNNSKSTE